MPFDLDKFAKKVEVMQEVGITKTEIARRAGISKQRLANILSGRFDYNNMKLKTIESLATAVGVHPKHLIM